MSWKIPPAENKLKMVANVAAPVNASQKPLVRLPSCSNLAAGRIKQSTNDHTARPSATIARASNK